MAEYDFETDYLVVGAGAMGVAFADEILHRDSQAHVTLVDRRSKPGGHWNDAYSFVTLHQPALYYGVNSETLGGGGHDLVSKAQVLGYFERVLNKLQKTGRLTFLSQSEYEGNGRVRSLLRKDHSQTLKVRRRLVDATYSQVQVPSTSPPPFSFDDDVTVVPINAAANGLAQRPARPVFEPGRITLQPVTHCQPTFGAAMIAHVEWRFDDDATKNKVTMPVPHPMVPEDFPVALHTMVQNLANMSLPLVSAVGRMRLNAMIHASFVDNLKLFWTYLRWHRPFFSNMQKLFPLPSISSLESPEHVDNHDNIDAPTQE